MARRTRYQVTLRNFVTDEVTKRNFLGYAPESAHKFYQNSFEVLKVERVKRGMTTSAGKTNPKWRPITTARLKPILDELGITLPVIIKLTGHQGGRCGAHGLRETNKAPRGVNVPPNSLYHHITLKSWMDIEQAGKTLWHELAHAMQAERAMRRKHGDHFRRLDPSMVKRSWHASSERGKGIGYRNKPHEVEARTYESRHDSQRLVMSA